MAKRRPTMALTDAVLELLPAADAEAGVRPRAVADHLRFPMNEVQQALQALASDGRAAQAAGWWRRA